MDDDKEVTATFGSNETPTQTLIYERTGNGNGSVSFAPAGTFATCAENCRNVYAAGTSVTVTASPAAGMEFTGWSGACSGTGACTVTMSETRTVRAGFRPDGKVALNFTCPERARAACRSCRTAAKRCVREIA